MIVFKHQYYKWIESRGVGSRDRVASSPDSYVSYLNSVSDLLGRDISPDLLSSEEEVERIARSIAPFRSVRTVLNYKSAMRQYVAMVNAGILSSSSQPASPEPITRPSPRLIRIRPTKVEGISEVNGMPIRNELREIGATLRLGDMSPIDLLRSFAAVIDELQRRGIARSINNPLADYTEWLVSTKLGLNLVANSRSGFDATSADGMRYQIKGRRVGAESTSIQLSALRNLNQRNFDYLVGVVFEPGFSIRHAAVVPHEVVVERSTYNAHTNSHIFHMRPSLLEDQRVQDVRDRLMA
jgi:hypothetical protein